MRDEYVELDRAQWGRCPPTTVSVSLLSPSKFLYAPAMLNSLSAQNPDLVHCHGIWTYHAWATVRWVGRSQRPFMVSPHGMLDHVDLAKSRFVKFVAKQLYVDRLLHNAHCIRCLCQSEAESARAFGLRNPLCVIPNGIDFAPSKDAAPPWNGAVPPESKVLCTSDA